MWHCSQWNWCHYVWRKKMWLKSWRSRSWIFCWSYVTFSRASCFSGSKTLWFSKGQSYFLKPVPSSVKRYQIVSKVLTHELLCLWIGKFWLLSILVHMESSKVHSWVFSKTDPISFHEITVIIWSSFAEQEAGTWLARSSLSWTLTRVSYSKEAEYEKEVGLHQGERWVQIWNGFNERYVLYQMQSKRSDVRTVYHG